MAPISRTVRGVPAMLRPLQRLLGRLRRRLEPAPPAAPEAEVELDRILVLLAHHRGDPEPRRLLSGRMSSRHMRFSAPSRLEEGQVLTLQILLDSGVSLKIPALVLHQEADPRGEIRGTLALGPTEADRQVLSAFLARRGR